jgi:hypothetical protein
MEVILLFTLVTNKGEHFIIYIQSKQTLTQ